MLRRHELTPAIPRIRRNPAIQGRALSWTGSFVLSLLTWLGLTDGIVQAHPMSQGALEITILPDRINLRAIVSTEEVLVAASLNKRQSSAYSEAILRHGDYLLAHFRVSADGRRLIGRVVERPSETAPRPSYTLEYTTRDSTPELLVLQQDVLREFEFAPGNPWEASYVVRASAQGTVLVEGALLTSDKPLSLNCRGPLSEGGSRVKAAPFVRLGIMHILAGYDHLLFIGALLLAVTTVWDLVKVVSVFTLAHTITLVLAALNVVRLPEKIVEPMIALSIVFVAAQNVFWPERSRGSQRLLVAFLFGLFHGLGFAGGLLDAMSGINLTGAVRAVAAFSVGVELGHQIVVLPVFYGLSVLRRVWSNKCGHDQFMRQCGSTAISVMGIVYLVAALR